MGTWESKERMTMTGLEPYIISSSFLFLLLLFEVEAAIRMVIWVVLIFLYLRLTLCSRRRWVIVVMADDYMKETSVTLIVRCPHSEEYATFVLLLDKHLHIVE